jgi:t-SNARE complex subunit (syntaxin)
MTTENIVIEHLRHIRAKVDQIADDITDVHRDAGKIETRIDASMSSVKTTITVAGIVLTIIIAISGFFVDKAWDSVVNHIDISVKK